FRLVINSALLKIGPFIVRHLALPYAELSFYLAVLPIELKDDKRAAFHLCLAIELLKLVSMQHQFADQVCGRDFVTGPYVEWKVRVVKANVVVFDSSESVADVC